MEKVIPFFLSIFFLSIGDVIAGYYCGDSESCTLIITVDFGSNYYQQNNYIYSLNGGVDKTCDPLTTSISGPVWLPGGYYGARVYKFYWQGSAWNPIGIKFINQPVESGPIPTYGAKRYSSIPTSAQILTDFPNCDGIPDPQQNFGPPCNQVDQCCS